MYWPTLIVSMAATMALGGLIGCITSKASPQSFLSAALLCLGVILLAVLFELELIRQAVVAIL